MTDLNAINELNLQTPGKICFVSCKIDETNVGFPIFSLEEFDPAKHELIIKQIWTYEQACLVRKEIDYLYSVEPNNYEKIASWQQILIDWLDSSEDLAIGILND